MFFEALAMYLRVMGQYVSIGGMQSWENLLKTFESNECPQIPLKCLSRYYLT